MWDFVHKPLQDRSGATAIEYGLLIGVIAMSLVLGMSAFGNEMTNLWKKVDKEVVKAND
jgi:pilus assembly protein Flp/PilA